MRDGRRGHKHVGGRDGGQGPAGGGSAVPNGDGDAWNHAKGALEMTGCQRARSPSTQSHQKAQAVPSDVASTASGRAAP